MFVGRPLTLHPKRFLKRVQSIIKSQQYTNGGPQVQELEQTFGESVGGYCVAVANATLGLQLAAHILTRKTVLMPSFTFIATPHSLSAGHVWGDIELDNLGLDHTRLLTLDFESVLAVNLFGGCCRIKQIEGICQSQKVPLIFDSAHGIGVKYRGKPLGLHGNCEVFSLHATKIVNGFEGGLITTSDQALAIELRELRNFGFAESGKQQGEHKHWGTNAKMSEVHAALALTNLESLPELLEIYEERWALYRQLCPVELFDPRSADIMPNFSYVVALSKYRDRLCDALWTAGIQARKYFDPPCHKHPNYYSPHVYLPNTDRVAFRVLALPTGPAVKLKDVRRVCGIMKDALKGLPRE